MRPRRKAADEDRDGKFENSSPTTESEAIAEDDSAELGNSLVESSSSLAAVRRLQDRVPTPGPRRTVSANQHSLSGSPRSPQIAETSLEEHAEEGENEVGTLRASNQSNRHHKLRPDMKRFFCSSRFFS